VKKCEAPHDFEGIRASLNGMLQAEVYEEYYRIARHRSQGSILELGTGQGASVAFALGVKDSGRFARVIAIDEFSF
jgi:methylase of polypeptide subunit release factors